jgi:hypothetical protein
LGKYPKVNLSFETEIHNGDQSNEKSAEIEQAQRDKTDATSRLHSSRRYVQEPFMPDAFDQRSQYPEDDIMSTLFSSRPMLSLILRWKYHLAVILLLAAVLASVFSAPFFIKPKYKSFAVVYPSNLIPYSSETPTEQMLQLFKSEDITQHIIQKFDLAKHYSISQNDIHFRSKLKAEYEDNVRIKKTEYESVLIEVYDTDPAFASSMAEEMILMMNNKARQLQRDKTAEVVKIYYDQLIVKEQQIDSVEKRMEQLRSEYGLLDYTTQVKEYTRGYVKNLNAGKSGNNPEFKSTFDNLKQYGGEFLILEGYLAGLTESYNEIKNEYDKSISDLKKELTYTNVVTAPYPADKKSYPVRWLIVLFSVTSTFFLSLIALSVIDNLKTKKKETLTEANSNG